MDDLRAQAERFGVHDADLCFISNVIFIYITTFHKIVQMENRN